MRYHTILTQRLRPWRSFFGCVRPYARPAVWKANLESVLEAPSPERGSNDTRGRLPGLVPAERPKATRRRAAAAAAARCRRPAAVLPRQNRSRSRSRSSHREKSRSASTPKSQRSATRRIWRRGARRRRGNLDGRSVILKTTGRCSTPTSSTVKGLRLRKTPAPSSPGRY